MRKLLKKAILKKIIRPIDFYFSQFIDKNNEIIMLIASCVSYESNNGMIFLPISYFKKQNFFSTSNKAFIKKILDILGEKINWLYELKKHTAVSNGSIDTPIVLIKQKIYLYKIWKAEKNILKYLNNNTDNETFNQSTCLKVINTLFPEHDMNFQKIAVILSLINRITFICGGPGTGKTTTILKIIVMLIKNSPNNIKIQLAAPTGKATTRLNEVLNNKLINIYLTKSEKKYLAVKAVTLHQLLGIKMLSQESFFHQKNLLNIDVLIVDESSMIDIITMEQIFSAMNQNTKIIFIGDHNQLKPIGSGSIIKDLCVSANNRYSLKISNLLNFFTQNNFFFTYKNTKKIKYIHDNICILTKNYRFKKNSGIYSLSRAILTKNQKTIQKLFDNLIKNVKFYNLNNAVEYEIMIQNILLHYQRYWEKIYQKKNIKELMETFHNYKVLCALREGEFGVQFINKIIEYEMHKKNIKDCYNINNTTWYIGKPIMITKNNQYLQIFNGDIGITRINLKNKLQVSFLSNDGNIKNIPIEILRNYETAWAITVHKAQGSEFNNISLILPNFYSKILNKEILYTGVTRARGKVDIFSNREIFKNTILKK